LNGRYVFKSFCQINDYYDHNRAREDNPQHRSLREEFFRRHETSNLKHLQIFIEPPFLCNYDEKGFSLRKAIHGHQYHSTPVINYGKKPTSRGKLAELGYSVRLPSQTDTELYLDTLAYLSSYVQISTQTILSRGFWINSTQATCVMGNRIPYFCHNLGSKFNSIHSEWYSVIDMDSENYNLLHPPPSGYVDKQGNKLPPEAATYFDIDSVCFTEPPWLTDYDSEGRRLPDKGKYLPEENIKTGFQVPDWIALSEHTGNYPAFEFLTQNITPDYDTTDIYRDLLKYKMISQLILHKVKTEIVSTEEGRNYRIKWTGINLKPKSNHDQNTFFTKCVKFNLFVSSVILYPPLRADYTEDGRKKSKNHYYPIPQINLKDDDEKSPEFREKYIMTMRENWIGTQLDFDIAAYYLMDKVMRNTLENKRDSYSITCNQPTGDEEKKGEKFRLHLFSNGFCINQMENIDPMVFFNSDPVAKITKHIYPTCIVKGDHPNSIETDFEHNILDIIFSNKREILKSKPLQVQSEVNVGKNRKTKYTKYESMKTNLSIFGSFIAPPLSFTYDETGTRKPFYKPYSPKPLINYWGLRYHLLEPFTFRSFRKIPEGSELEEDVKKYHQNVEWLFRFGCEVAGEPFELKTTPEGREIDLKTEPLNFKTPFLRYMFKLDNRIFPALSKIQYIAKDFSLGVPHPNMTFQPDFQVNLENEEHMEIIKLKARTTHFPSTVTPAQREQLEYLRKVRNLSIFGTIVMPPLVQNYDELSKRKEEFKPEFQINELAFTSTDTRRRGFTKLEQDPNYRKDNASFNLRQDIKFYETKIKLLFILGTQVIPPRSCLYDINHLRKQTSSYSPSDAGKYQASLISRPSWVMTENKNKEFIKPDPPFDPWNGKYREIFSDLLRHLETKLEERIIQIGQSEIITTNPQAREFDNIGDNLKQEEPVHEDEEEEDPNKHIDEEFKSTPIVANIETFKFSSAIYSKHPNRSENNDLYDGSKVVHRPSPISKEENLTNIRLKGKNSAKLIEIYEQAKIDLSIFGAFVEPPRDSSPNYQAPLLINKIMHTRYDISMMYGLTIQKEKEIKRIHGHPMRRNYEIYERKVEQFLREGCHVKWPIEIINNKNINEDQPKLQIGLQDFALTGLDQTQIDETNIRDYNLNQSHPNVLPRHRYHYSRPQYVKDRYKSCLSQQKRDQLEEMRAVRDLSIFGSYIHPLRLDQRKIPRNINFRILINSMCFRYNDFEEKYLLGIEALNKMPPNSEKHLKKYLELVHKLVTTGVHAKMQNGQITLEFGVKRQETENNRRMLPGTSNGRLRGALQFHTRFQTPAFEGSNFQMNAMSDRNYHHARRLNQPLNFSHSRIRGRQNQITNHYRPEQYR